MFRRMIPLTESGQYTEFGALVRYTESRFPASPGSGSNEMSAYLIVDTQIDNPDTYEEYKRLAKPIAEKYGGVYRARGGAMDVLETDLWSPTRMVIIEFPDMDAARAFVDSEEYAPVKPLRQRNARCTLLIVEGC
jgi:uncharacterized protein (DUF1330 family)